jgi:2-dehydropantoate 2-reductase
MATGAAAPVRILEALDEDTPYDLLIVTVLDHQIEALLPALRRSAACAILFMFVTFGPERLRDAVGAERCAFAMPFLQANVGPDGKIKALIGAGGQKSLVGQPRWADLFNAAGIPARLEANMPLWLRCHVPVCVAFQSISVAGERRGGGASWRDAMRIARGVRASFQLIQGLGHPLYPKFKVRMMASPLWLLALVLWSLSRVRSFRELLATGQAEGCALTDAMVAASALAQPPVSTSAIAAMKPI